MPELSSIAIPCMLRGDSMPTLARVVRPEAAQIAGDRLAKLAARRGETPRGDGAGVQPSADTAPPEEAPMCIEKVLSMPDTLIERDGALAIIHINGPMSFGYDICDWFEGGCWSVQVAAAIDQVAQDNGVAAVLFKIHSPGGTCAGMSDVIAACTRLRKAGKIAINVLANEDCCSALYWLACACTQDSGKIVATTTAAVGSVGVKIMLVDASEAFKMAGMRLVAATTGKEKVDGALGAPISKDVEARFAAKNEELFADFLGDVALARGKSEEIVRGWEGAYFYGKSALKNGLIDELVDATAFINSMRMEYGMGGTYMPGQTASPAPETDDGPNAKQAASTRKPEESTMAETPTTPSTPANTPAAPQPASIAELKAIFGADGNSVLASMEAKHTVAQAQSVRIEQLNKANTDTAAALSAEQAKNAQLSTLAPASSTPPIGNGQAPAAGTGGNHPAPRGSANDHAFIKALKAHATANKTTPGKALAGFAAANPELHQAYLASLPKGSPIPLSSTIQRTSALA